jgi:uncharacterized repeat protein (TIGR04042 family)
MPEIRFRIQWPDGTQETCYSPSLVVKDYFVPAQVYELDEFIQRATASLQIASDRVQAKYGMPCSLALGQLQKLQTTAQQYRDQASAQVTFLEFFDSSH